jgi:hypothetical protein
MTTGSAARRKKLAYLLLAYGAASLLLLTVYAALGMDSLGHYVLAPLSAHSLAMNATILLEVTAAALVLVEVARQIGARAFRGSATVR